MTLCEGNISLAAAFAFQMASGKEYDSTSWSHHEWWRWIIASRTASIYHPSCRAGYLYKNYIVDHESNVICDNVHQRQYNVIPSVVVRSIIYSGGEPSVPSCHL